MLLSIGFIMITRLNPDSAKRQFLIVAAATIIAMIIPIMIKKMTFLKKWALFYAVAGIGLLAFVLVFGDRVNGAKININIGSFAFQPSEFVKIIFVFFVASRLYKKSAQFKDHVITTAIAAAYVLILVSFAFQPSEFVKIIFVFFVASRLYKKSAQFKDHVITTAIAAAYVLILVLSRDLGSAVVFFVTYVVMLYVATKKPFYLFAGFGSGCGAAVIAYFLFSHVRQRVVAWKNPFSVYQNEGYQIVQGLFAIGTGGWFGMGLCQGSPEMIPFVKQDYMFAAICEELGGLFAICMILICMSMFLLVVNISLRIKKRFYKLIALGLGTEYAFQVFLTIGGVTKFIPMTGITLPLVSYGGSSVLSTIIMLAIIQGLYILREDEDEEFEKQK